MAFSCRAPRIPLILVSSLAGLLLLLLISVFGRNYLVAETRGAVPLEMLAQRGSPIERSATGELAGILAAGPYPRDWTWAARRERSANGDTIRFAVYREKDTRFYRRMVQPEPVVAGGGVYVVSEARWHVGGDRGAIAANSLVSIGARG